jgi:topoisomerase-4 subunit B
VILTTLHSGGKFSGKAYDTSGGLHGVGSSVVNALSDSLEVEVARGGELFRQSYARGKPVTRLKREGEVRNRRGTLLRFHPDPEIFGKLEFRAERLFRLCRSKAYLYRGVEIRWRCAPELVPKDEKGGETPAEATLHFPGGLSDFLASAIEGKAVVVPAPSPAWPISQTAPGAANGRSPGWSMARGSYPPTPTPSRRRRAARTRPGCAARW